jgi:hypothetical protein
MILSRRTVVAMAAAVPLGMVGLTGARAAAPACYDPAALPLSQRNRRRSLGYVEPSADPKKSCSGCAFFTAGAQTGCGTCQLLSGGPVSAGAVCTSFAAKAR